MQGNPLFPDPHKTDDDSDSYLLPKKDATVHPFKTKPDQNAAAEVIRQKLDRIYANEPDTRAEIAETKTFTPQSKHQEFMHRLANSGKNLADIQTEWHRYYISLPDHEKHEVWREFYDSSSKARPEVPQPAVVVPAYQPPQPTLHYQAPQTYETPTYPKPVKHRREHRLQENHPPKPVAQTVHRAKRPRPKLEARHHLHSLIFGLSLGVLVIFIFLFGFFNEFIIAPFIQPSRHTGTTPLILSSDGVAPTPNPEVIIPKINVELPVDFSQTSTNEATIEDALESGVVHYPTTSLPGQNGNSAFFGHSSNNIFNKGKYKFAFVLLHELVPGDTFYVTNQSKVYVYKVISKTIVDPSDVGVLGPVKGQTATATLITCDPPGTSAHRLIVVGQQISPDLAGNTVPTVPATTATANTSAELPGNGPTLWSRFWHAIF